MPVEDRLAARAGAVPDGALLRPDEAGVVQALRRDGVPAGRGRVGATAPVVQAQPVHADVARVDDARARPDVLTPGHGASAPAGEDHRPRGRAGHREQVERTGVYSHRGG